MSFAFSSFWTDYIRLLVRRPSGAQVAALCYRGAGKDRQILLITSRDTGRWIIPKGWPIKGLDAAGAAKQEAWEEAGVRGEVTTQAIGEYTYDKGMDAGYAVPCTTSVFPVKVTEVKDDFPEADERRRKWVSPADAATMVQEPELQKILANF